MRLLFDEPLSEELIEVLRDLFPESLHVRSLGAGGAPDDTIWALANSHNCMLVTKDEDFHRMSIVHRAPPKVDNRTGCPVALLGFPFESCTL